jgi:hypothetical protein
MRTIFQLFLVVFLSGLLIAQDTEKATATEQPPRDAWLGLGVSKPDETTANHLPTLPPGIGFVVSSLAQDGPAEKAGIEKLDLFWKMNEQMLVNEGQLATLLRLANPGEEVTISIFRKGEPLDLKVKLGESKRDTGAAMRHIFIDSVMRRDDGALRIVNIEKKTAAITNERGSAEVSRVEGGDSVRILDTKGEIIFEGFFSGRSELSTVPDPWRRQVCAMRRGLDHALSATAAPERQPRPRIVPPAVPAESKVQLRED